MTKKEEKVLLPTATNKFLMQWKGPFKTVKKKVRKVYYKINVCWKIKTFHANMLKLYVKRDNNIDIGIAGEAVVEIEDDDGNETLTTRSKEKRSNRWDSKFWVNWWPV